MSNRKARLRPEYAGWYPGIGDSQWHDAGWVREVVQRQLQRGSPAWEMQGRVLNERHFEFEGGDFGPAGGRERRRQRL